MFGRIWHLFHKELIQFTRDRLLLPVVLIVPVMEMMTLAYTTSQGVVHLPTAVYDQDRSRTSRGVVTAMANSRRFDPDYQAASPQEVETLLDRGAVKAAVLIPPHLSARMDNPNQEAYLQVLLDGTDAGTAAIAQAYAESTISAYIARRTMERLATLGQRAGTVDPQPRIWFNQDLRSENFFIPAEVGALLAFITAMLTALSITKERELGTLEQLLVTPLRGGELLAGKAMPAMLIAYADFMAMVALAVFWFDVPLKGSLGLLMGLAAFYTVVEMGLGLLVSVLSQTQGQALLSIFFIDSLAIVLSGYIIPVENMPLAAQWVARLLPLTYFVEILRGIFLKASTLGDFWGQIAALAVLGTALFVLSAWRLRRGLE